MESTSNDNVCTSLGTSVYYISNLLCNTLYFPSYLFYFVDKIVCICLFYINEIDNLWKRQVAVDCDVIQFQGRTNPMLLHTTNSIDHPPLYIHISTGWWHHSVSSYIKCMFCWFCGFTLCFSLFCEPVDLLSTLYSQNFMNYYTEK